MAQIDAHTDALPNTQTVRVSPLRGEVVFMYAFDVAYEMIRAPVTKLLGQDAAQFVVDASKRSPKQLFFYRPQMVRLPPVERFGPRGPLRLERIVKLLPVGAISISVRVPFEVQSIQDLVAFHDLRFSDGNWLASWPSRSGGSWRDITSARCSILAMRRRTPPSASTARLNRPTACQSAPKIGCTPTAGRLRDY